MEIIFGPYYTYEVSFLVSGIQNKEDVHIKTFSFFYTKTGELHISENGRIVMTKKGKEALKLHMFLTNASSEDIQKKLAVITGKFKFGNER